MNVMDVCSLPFAGRATHQEGCFRANLSFAALPGAAGVRSHKGVRLLEPACAKGALYFQLDCCDLEGIICV